ncbi:MAG: methyl-accepting chemotaxis protein, partial [Proteobacteria bacterium]|nr:methyl-accepting chemotaxis protein [Pseudomonadota bacterium]
MRITIKLKLALSFALVVAMLIALAVLSITNLSKLNNSLTELIYGPALRLEYALTASGSLAESIRQQKNALLVTNTEEMAAYYEKSDAALAIVRDVTTKGLAIADEEGKPLWERLLEAVTAYENTVKNLHQTQLTSGQQAAINLSNGDIRTAATAMTAAATDLVAADKVAMGDAEDAAKANYESTRLILIAIAGAATLIGAIAAVWMSLSIARGLRRGVELAEAVAIGDLNHTVTHKANDEIKDLMSAMQRMTANLRETAGMAAEISNGNLTVTPRPLSDKDTLGQSLLDMVERLRSVVADALVASDNVSAGSQQLSSASEQIAQGATEQASSAEEASSSMEEMASNIKQNADNAAQTEKIARQ